MTKRAARPGHVGRGREPEPPETMERRFAALGGAEALKELWKRPRLHAAAWIILDSIDRARARIVRARREYRREYGSDHAARDTRRKARLPRVFVLDMTEPPRGWTLRRPGVLVRVSAEGRPLSFRLARGQSIEADVLADLRERLAALGVPSRGPRNLLAALVALARP